MTAIVHSIYSQSVHAPALDAGLMDNDAERYCKSETSKGSKTRLYQIVHTTDNVFLIVELAITRSKMGLET